MTITRTSVGDDGVSSARERWFLDALSALAVLAVLLAPGAASVARACIPEPVLDASLAPEARRLLELAPCLAQAHDYANAGMYFERAADLMEGHHARAAVLFNAAATWELAEDAARARRLYLRVLAAAPTATLREETERRLAELDGRLMPRSDSILPGYRVDGPAVVRELEVRIDCDEEPPGNARCRVSVRGVLEPVAEGVRLSVTRGLGAGSVIVSPTEARMDGSPFVLSRRLRAIQASTVELAFEAVLSTRSDLFQRFFSQSALGARHPIFGEGALGYRGGATMDLRPIAGDELRLVGPATVHVSSVETVHIRALGDRARADLTLCDVLPHLRIDLRPADEAPDGPLAHGGPVMALGGRYPIDQPRNLRVLFSLGYEIGLFEHLLASISLETDFDSISEALVVEAALPGLVFLVPSVSAGVGVVARQLGPRDADVALRLRVTGSLVAAGFVADFDYWPAIGGWTASLAGRVSL